MTNDPTKLHQLQQVAAQLDVLGAALDTICFTIDGRLASIDAAGEQWAPHPLLPNTQLRRVPSPAGAPYHMMESRSLAGAGAEQVQLSHATDMHVLAGQVAVRRAGQQETTYHETGSCARFAAQEAHSLDVLQDCHQLFIFHLTPPPIYGTPENTPTLKEQYQAALASARAALARMAAVLSEFCTWFMHRHVENIGLLGALIVATALSYGLYLLDPRTPSISLATLQVLSLAPILHFIVLHAAVWTYKYLFPAPFKQLMGALGDKLTELVLPELDELLPPEHARPDYFTGAGAVEIARFKLIYHVSKFLIRCTRYVLFALPLFVLFKSMQAMLTLALNLQPH